jgi:hypothetical protein
VKLRTRMGDHVDSYHGVAVPDPYRWLEDDSSAETAAWVEAQMSVTLPYFERIPFRAALHARVLELNDYEKYSAPLRKGPYLFFTRNAGLQNQSVLFIQAGRDGAPEVLIDPNAWSSDRLPRRHVGLLHVQLAERSADHLRVRHRDRHECRLPALGGSRLRSRPLRHDAGLLQQLHVTGSTGDPGRIERRAARRRGHQSAAGGVSRRDCAGRRDGHAALSQVHHRLELGRRLRIERRPGGVQDAVRLLTPAQHQGSKRPRTSTRSCSTIWACRSGGRALHGD